MCIIHQLHHLFIGNAINTGIFFILSTPFHPRFALMSRSSPAHIVLIRSRSIKDILRQDLHYLVNFLLQAIIPSTCLHVEKKKVALTRTTKRSKVARKVSSVSASQLCTADELLRVSARKSGLSARRGQIIMASLGFPSVKRQLQPKGQYSEESDVSDFL